MAQRSTIHFTLNGRPAEAQAATDENAIELLQRDFALNGARVSCAQGLCGCCTIEVDGVAASGCLLLAPLLDGCDVKTVESWPMGTCSIRSSRRFWTKLRSSAAFARRASS